MKPIDTEFTNARLRAPFGWDAEKNGVCAELFTHYDGVHFFSWWRLSWRERIGVLFGKPVRLSIMAAAHPPVSLQVTEG